MSRLLHNFNLLIIHFHIILTQEKYPNEGLEKGMSNGLIVHMIYI